MTSCLAVYARPVFCRQIIVGSNSLFKVISWCLPSASSACLSLSGCLTLICSAQVPRVVRTCTRVYQVHFSSYSPGYPPVVRWCNEQHSWSQNSLRVRPLGKYRFEFGTDHTSFHFHFHFLFFSLSFLLAKELVGHRHLFQVS